MKVKLAIILFCLLQIIPVQAAEYSFGVVPQFEARQLYAIWKPIFKVLEQKTGHTFKMLGTESISEFEREFGKGSYDFAYMNPWHSLVAFEKQGYLPLVRDNVRKLNGVLVVRKDSGIKEISQLEGKRVAFPSPNALGASLLMRAELKRLHGVSIKPIYVGTHSSVYLNVALNQASAGGGVLRSFKNQKPNVQGSLNIIYKTQSIAPHPISAHPRVPKEVIAQVTRAFLEMKNDPVQQALLAKIPMKQPVAASAGDYQPLKEMGLEPFYVKD
ncbi:MAG: PhnD/SsuA/transferrin family substrate-binding protein [Methylomarinum sp.]|nr:PhnD/SsuA/transferrin family substrate-binding protein [Methylomarinum sp.]